MHVALPVAPKHTGRFVRRPDSRPYPLRLGPVLALAAPAAFVWLTACGDNLPGQSGLDASAFLYGAANPDGAATGDAAPGLDGAATVDAGPGPDGAVTVDAAENLDASVNTYPPPVHFGQQTLTLEAGDGPDNADPVAASIDIIRSETLARPHLLASESATGRLFMMSREGPFRVVEMHPSDGYYQIVMDEGVTSGSVFSQPMVHDALNNRLLVVDSDLDALVAIDLATNHRVGVVR